VPRAGRGNPFLATPGSLAQVLTEMTALREMRELS